MSTRPRPGRPGLLVSRNPKGLVGWALGPADLATWGRIPPRSVQAHRAVSRSRSTFPRAGVRNDEHSGSKVGSRIFALTGPARPRGVRRGAGRRGVGFVGAEVRGTASRVPV